MAGSAHAYVSGEHGGILRVDREKKLGGLLEGPAVWICGDYHTGNFGPMAALDGRIAIRAVVLGWSEEEVAGMSIFDCSILTTWIAPRTGFELT
jgi:uncharacterized protein (DUF2252 family)